MIEADAVSESGALTTREGDSIVVASCEVGPKEGDVRTDASGRRELCWAAGVVHGGVAEEEEGHSGGGRGTRPVVE